MKVYGFLRAAVLSAVIIGAAVDARKAGKTLCDADPTTAPVTTPGLKGSVVAAEATPPPANQATVVTVAPATTAPATDDGDDDNDDGDDVSVATVAPGGDAATAPAAAGGTSAPAPTDAGTSAPAPAETPAPAATTATPAATTSAPASTGGAQTKVGTIKSKFSYVGSSAGGPGSYQMVTDYATCTKQTEKTSSPVSPLDDDVTLVFRGPMNIYNIAVFDGTSGSWNKVSSYTKGGSATNMVFMNNRNIDYGGKSSPEGFSTADGKGNAKESTPFGGNLAAASNPYGQSIYADEKTGTEVHIMTSKKCGQDGACKGYYDKDGTAFQGWGGAKKMFVTKVDMAQGGAPNLPAIWMLNAQIVRSNQYQCNCRGMGKGGGCGELDIAEVIEKDTSVVATHYYFYDGQTAPGHDSFGKRPVDGPTTYVTIIDESYGVKVLEIGADDFDFEASSVTQDVISQWEKA
ncbi:Gpi anchor protein, partial [Globisporangium splendens]